MKVSRDKPVRCLHHSPFSDRSKGCSRSHSIWHTPWNVCLQELKNPHSTITIDNGIIVDKELFCSPRLRIAFPTLLSTTFESPCTYLHVHVPVCTHARACVCREKKSYNWIVWNSSSFSSILKYKGVVEVQIICCSVYACKQPCCTLHICTFGCNHKWMQDVWWAKCRWAVLYFAMSVITLDCPQDIRHA